MSFAAAAAAMAWGSAHGWDAYAFRVYYLAGALLSAPLLGIGSLQLMRRRWAAPVGLLWTGVAIGLTLGVHVHGTFGGTDVPRAQDHLDALPRVLAIAASSLGTAAVVRRRSSHAAAAAGRQLLLLAAVGAAAAASALTQTAVAAAAACFALAAALLYAAATRRSRLQKPLEERAVALQGHPQVLGRDVLAARPLLLELRACIVEALCQVAEQLGDERVRLADRVPRLVDELRLQAATARGAPVRGLGRRAAPAARGSRRRRPARHARSERPRRR